MATQTTNYGLTKPSYNETADIGVINSNMDIIDAKMKENADNVSTLATEVDGVKSDVVYYGQSGYLSKNLLNPTLQTTTLNGITCTNNGDGTYTLNGTANNSTFFNIGEININKLRYKMVGCPSGGDYNNKYAIYFDKNGDSNTKIIDIGDGVTFEGEGTQAIYIVIRRNYHVNNLVFKPMITTDLSVTYDDFTPYAPSNTELQGSKADNSVVSDAWDASTTYAVGQYCIYNNSLWKCLVQHSGQTPSEGTYWTKTSITSELIALWNAINT